MSLTKLSDNRLVVKLKTKYSLNQFISKAKVIPGSYGEDFSINIYNMIFNLATDVIKEYTEYYMDEYDSISDFLFWRFYLPKDVINELNLDKAFSGYLGIVNNYSWENDQDGIFSEAINRLISTL
jgi:hypothetical protein